MGWPGRRWRTRYCGIRVRAVDLISLGYMGAVAILLLLFSARVPSWAVFVFVHLCYVVFGLEAIRASDRRPEDRLLAVVRLLYPGFIIVYGFLEIGQLQHVFFRQPWATPHLVAGDLALFGVHPTLWFKDFYTPWLDECMAVFRVAYFVTPCALLLPLLVADRRDAIAAAGAIVILTYVCNFLLFLVFPAVSPRMVPEIAALDPREYTGFLFAAMERGIQGDEGALVGAAFPSAHVSATVAWTFVAYRFLPRWVGHLMLFFCAGTAVSAVYFGFHHAVDALGGILLGVACYPLAVFLLQACGEFTEPPRHLKA